VWKGTRRIANALLKRFHPWSLQIADVDGHGEAIAVGVTKPTHNLPFPHRALFLMRFDGDELRRKWTGSTMGRPLDEFCFAPRKPQALVTLEECLDGRVALSCYRWNGFGFTKKRERFWQSAAHLRPGQEGLELRGNGRHVSLPWSDLLE